MKLKAYTPEETDDLISRFNVIAEYAYSINEAAYNLLVQKHLNYLKYFKPSLFHWKPRNFKYFVSKLGRYDNVRFEDWKCDENRHNMFKCELFKEPGKFIRGISFYECFDHYMHKHSGQRLTKEEKTLLYDADNLTTFTIGGRSIHEKYRNLVKYAHRPFEFDESDIGWLESVEYYYNKAIKWNSN